MGSSVVKYVVDVGLLVSFLGASITGVVKFRSFLSIIGMTPDYSSMNMNLYRQIHDWSGLVMVFLVLVHLMLNWSWIVSVTKGFFVKEESEIKGKGSKKKKTN
jgi:hypothetical protein